jgi:molybdopterin synthase sulfur carrier subunit
MATVRIPPVLRTHVGQAKQVEASGATVGALVDDLVGRYPGLREQLLTADGSLHRFVNVYLNGQDVRYLDGADTPVADVDTLIVLPAMAGGALEALAG